MTLRQIAPRLALVAALALPLLVLAGPAADAAKTKRKKTVTYLVALKVDGRTVAGPFSSTEKVTGDIVANPLGSTDSAEPTAWEAEGPLNFGPIVNTGLPAGCTLTTIAPTGTMKTSLTKSGGSLEVNWSTNSNPIVPSVVVCQGVPAPSLGAPAVEPFVLLEPKQFTISEAGGSQQLSGRLDAGKGMMENTGTMTITKRVECEPKVKEVNTYPPGQQTQVSGMVGRGFSPGEKVAADVNVELVFPDGSVMRMAKGSYYKETEDCGAMEDKSRSFKGTLLLGKIWHHVRKVFGEQTYEWNCGGSRCGGGVRGTTFWTSSGRTSGSVSVGKGSFWFSRLSRAGKLIGPKVIVKAGYTATMDRRGTITVRRSKPSDAFSFATP
jgi:hypothetical protein